jgi:GMP synthase (glutamine-hydrolysing)
MKPFLLLASRAEDGAAEEEYESYLTFGGLSPTQLHRVRMEAGPLPDIDLDRYSGIIVGGSPFLGACYGVGTLGRHQGAVVDRQFGEAIGAVPVSLTPEGRSDPLLAGLPDTFAAFVGHKEAVSKLPAHAVNLAGSPGCPVQMFRVRANLYATQFHPELDVPGRLTRISVYRNAGYFPPEEADAVMDSIRRQEVTAPPLILRNFTNRYAR